MSDLFLSSIPAHVCSGQSFGIKEIEEINCLYRLIKKREVECSNLFYNISTENRMVGLDRQRLNRVLSILSNIRCYHAFIRREMLSPSFSPESNCRICDAELRLSIKFIIRDSEKKKKEFKQKFLDYAYLKILHL